MNALILHPALLPIPLKNREIDMPARRCVLLSPPMRVAFMRDERISCRTRRQREIKVTHILERVLWENNINKTLWGYDDNNKCVTSVFAYNHLGGVNWLNSMWESLILVNFSFTSRFGEARAGKGTAKIHVLQSVKGTRNRRSDNWFRPRRVTVIAHRARCPWGRIAAPAFLFFPLALRHLRFPPSFANGGRRADINR